jgi:hypothetical protein
MEAFVGGAVFRGIRHDYIRLVETEALGGSLARRGVERQVTEEADQLRTSGRRCSGASHFMFRRLSRIALLSNARENGTGACLFQSRLNSGSVDPRLMHSSI